MKLRSVSIRRDSLKLINLQNCRTAKPAELLNLLSQYIIHSIIHSIVYDIVSYIIPHIIPRIRFIAVGALDLSII